MKDETIHIKDLKHFIENKKVANTRWGLCNNLELYFDFEPRYTEWRYFSGDRVYPIPSDNKKLTPEEFYWKRENLYSGEQLKYRLDLAEFLIKALENRIK